MDTDGDGLAGRLFLDDTLDVDDVFKTVDGCDLALATLIGASYDSDFVVLSDGDRPDLKMLERQGDYAIRETNVIFLTELLAERRAHDGTSNAGWGIVMGLSRFSP